MFTLLSFNFDYIVDFIVDLVSVLPILAIICICHLHGCLLCFKVR